MTTQNPIIDIVLPCYNPVSGWHINLVENINLLSKIFPDYTFHIILVNDGSVKGIDKACIHYLDSKFHLFTYLFYEQNKGKGYALREGFKQAKSEHMFFTDIDLPYTIDSMVSLIQNLITGDADIIAGNRNSDYYRNVPKFRAKLSKVVKFLVQKTISLPVSDTQCGLKGFNSKGRSVFLKTTINRYLFDVEFLFLASRKNSLKIIPIPVRLKEEVTFSKMNIWVLLTEGFNFLKILIKKTFKAKNG